MTVTLNGKGLAGSLCAIPSKSAAHRLLICAAMAKEPSYIECYPVSRDIEATAACLTALGAEIYYDGRGYTVSSPVTRGGEARMDCGESGSTLRFLLPVAAALGKSARLHMHARLPQRPLSPLDRCLEEHGAHLDGVGSTPLVIAGALCGGEYTLRADISSQFISGLLFALPLCREDSRLILEGKAESASYIKLTLDALEAFGIRVEKTENGYFIPGSQRFTSPGRLKVEGDWSNGAFWLCAKAMGADIKLTGLRADSSQGDRRITEIIESLAQPRQEHKIDVADIPDLVPPLAVLAACTPGETLIYNAGRLRIKESDRIETVRELLVSLGAAIETGADWLRIRGGKLHSGRVCAHTDHRIAMAAAIASVSGVDVTIDGFETVSKSYPGFLEDFRSLGGKAVTAD